MPYTHKSDFGLFRVLYLSLILGSTSYIPAHFIDGMVDLVIWGHEHQCLLQPELTVHGDKEIFISQPGSSVGKIIYITAFAKVQNKIKFHFTSFFFWVFPKFLAHHYYIQLKIIIFFK